MADTAQVPGITSGVESMLQDTKEGDLHGRHGFHGS